MKSRLSLTVAAFVLVLGLSGGAYAQSPGEMDQGRPPAAAPSAGASGPGNSDMGPGGPSGGAAQKNQGGPSVSGPKGDRPGLSAESEDKAQGTGQAGTKAQGKGDLETSTTGTKAEGKGELEAGGKAGTKAEGDIGAEGKAGTTAEGKQRDRAGKSVRLESQQVSKVRSHFSQHKPRVKSIDRNQVSVSIGVALPGAIALYDLPPDVIVVSGACPIKYFVWGEDIVLVDSCTREVVEIIAGVA
jgi:Protein of unknown function (DUF1236)